LDYGVKFGFRVRENITTKYGIEAWLLMAIALSNKQDNALEN